MTCRLGLGLLGRDMPLPHQGVSCPGVSFFHIWHLSPSFPPVPVSGLGEAAWGLAGGGLQRWPWVTSQMVSWHGAGNSQLPLAPSQPTSGSLTPSLPSPPPHAHPQGASSCCCWPLLLTPADSSPLLVWRFQFSNSWELGSCLFLAGWIEILAS